MSSIWLALMKKWNNIMLLIQEATWNVYAIRNISMFCWSGRHIEQRQIHLNNVRIENKLKCQNIDDQLFVWGCNYANVFKYAQEICQMPFWKKNFGKWLRLIWWTFEEDLKLLTMTYLQQCVLQYFNLRWTKIFGFAEKNQTKPDYFVEPVFAVLIG